MTTKTIILVILVAILIFIILYYFIQSEIERKAIAEERPIEPKALIRTSGMLFVYALLTTGGITALNFGTNGSSFGYNISAADSGGMRIDKSLADDLIANFGKRETRSIFFSEDIFNAMKQYGINDKTIQSLRKNGTHYKFGFSLVFGEYDSGSIPKANALIQKKNTWAKKMNKDLKYDKYDIEKELTSINDEAETLIAYPTIVWETVNTTGSNPIVEKNYHIIENQKIGASTFEPISYNIGSLCPDNCPDNINSIVPKALIK